MKKTGAQRLVTRDAVRHGAIQLAEDILLQLGLLCVTLFNMDTLCLTYSDHDRVPEDSHTLWKTGLTKDVT